MANVAEKLDDIQDVDMSHLIQDRIKILDSYQTGRGQMVAIWVGDLGKRLTFVMREEGDAMTFDGAALFCDIDRNVCALRTPKTELVLDPLTRSSRILRDHMAP